MNMKNARKLCTIKQTLLKHLTLLTGKGTCECKEHWETFMHMTALTVMCIEEYPHERLNLMNKQ